MNIPMSTTEAEALLCALGSYLPELEDELARLELPRDRHELVEREQLLRGIREKIAGVMREEEVSLSP